MAKSPSPLPPTHVVANSNRAILFSHRDSAIAYAEMERLADLYFSLNRRNLTVDLFFSSGPNEARTGTAYSVIAYYGDQTDQVEWLKQNVKESHQ